MEDSEESGPAGQVQEVFPPGGGVQESACEGIYEEEKHQSCNTPSKIRIKFSSNSMLVVLFLPKNDIF